MVDDRLWYRFRIEDPWVFLSSFTCGRMELLEADFKCNETLTLYIRAQETNGFSYGNHFVSYSLRSPDCESCNATAFFKTDRCQCINCTYFGTGCKSCSEAVKCLSPVNTTFAVFNGISFKCISLIAGCLTCSSASVCLICNQTNHFRLTGDNCTCLVGYALRGQDCLLCGSMIDNCIECSAPDTCLVCEFGYDPNPLGFCVPAVYSQLPTTLVLGAVGAVVAVLLVGLFVDCLLREDANAVGPTDDDLKLVSTRIGAISKCLRCDGSDPNVITKCGHPFHFGDRFCLEMNPDGQWICGHCQERSPYVGLLCSDCGDYYSDEHLYFPYRLRACECRIEANHEKCIQIQIQYITRKPCPQRAKKRQ